MTPELKIEPVPFKDRLLLDTPAAAKMLSVSVSTLEKLPIDRRPIPGTRCVRWKMEDLERYVREMM